ncbi:diguanylate cyclase domain-containing protein [Streptomyces sp. LUP47B]|uniref:diguanylate cyclase domain-containing protein n=1 Tax=Streptomyces sp. LUP47B TaxID=1890286 RepID=UPI003521352B
MVRKIYFKQINDTVEHAAGDRMLAVTADRLRRWAGSRGVAGRLGGDEFALAERIAAPETTTGIPNPTTMRHLQPGRPDTVPSTRASRSSWGMPLRRSARAMSNDHRPPTRQPP